MTEPTDAASQPGAPANSNAPFLAGKRNGQDVSWATEEEARKYAQMGLDYETKMQALNGERDQFRAQLEKLPEYEQFMERVNGDDTRRQLFQQVYMSEDPRQMLAKLAGQVQPQSPTSDLDDDDPHAPLAAAPTPDLAGQSAMRELNLKLDRVMARVNDSDLKQVQSQNALRLVALAENYSFLSGDANGTAKESAVSQAAMLMASDSTASPESAMMVSAENIRRIREGDAITALTKAAKTETLRTQPPGEGQPVTAEPPKVERKKSDLRSGESLDRIHKSQSYQDLMKSLGHL